MCASKTVEKRKLDILKRESLTCPSDFPCVVLLLLPNVDQLCNQHQTSKSRTTQRFFQSSFVSYFYFCITIKKLNFLPEN